MGSRWSALVAVAAFATAPARPLAADPLSLDVVGPRGIGRAGAVMVSADGSAALALNPAGLARRESARFQLGGLLIDSDVEYRGDTPDSPTTTDRAAPAVAPTLGYQQRVGPMVVGVAYLELADREVLLPEPALDQPEDDVARLFPHRYGGLGLRHSTHTLIAGAAMRVNDWLGVGLAVAATRVALRERRTVWAGFDGRDPVGNAARDLVVQLEASDAFVPGATLGVLIAPPELPIELAAAASARDRARMSGDVDVEATRSSPFPQAQEATDNRASARLSPVVEARAGVRYLGDRFTAELMAELETPVRRRGAPTWTTAGVTVVDESTATADLGAVPSALTERRRMSARGAADVEVVEGFLWLTAGYGYRSQASVRGRRTPIHPGLGTHIISVGAEGSWDGTTIVLGYARLVSKRAQVSRTQTDVAIINPFDAGSAPAGQGRYDMASDVFGLSVEASWE